MGVNNKKKIVFLFGAGAEVDYGIPSGAEFKKIFINATRNGEKDNFKISKYIELICSIKKKEKSGEERIIDNISNGSILSSAATSILYQTYKESQKFKEYVDDQNISEIKDYIDKKNDSYPKFRDYFRNEICNRISENNNELITKFLENVNIYSYLDGMFNYLREPGLYKKEIAKVIKIYYLAHYAIMQHLYNGYYDILEKASDSKEKIIELVNSNSYSNKSSKKPYYELIREYVDRFDIKLITTNYTKIAQQTINLKDTDISYLHGRLDLFENIETKEIKEIKKFKNNSNDIAYFPFIMVQSGVKPIVSPYQIKEFAKAIRYLENADVVVVLGYGINSDDEHIQTMLKGCIKKKTELYYFIYDEKNFSSIEEKTKEILKNCKCKKTSEFEDFLEELANKQ